MSFKKITTDVNGDVDEHGRFAEVYLIWDGEEVVLNSASELTAFKYEYLVSAAVIAEAIHSAVMVLESPVWEYNVKVHDSTHFSLDGGCYISGSLTVEKRDVEVTKPVLIDQLAKATRVVQGMLRTTWDEWAGESLPVPQPVEVPNAP